MLGQHVPDLQEFCAALERAASELFVSGEMARNALTVEVVRFTDAGVELAIKVAVPRMASNLTLNTRRPWQSRVQRTLLGMAKVCMRISMLRYCPIMCVVFTDAQRCALLLRPNAHPTRHLA